MDTESKFLATIGSDEWFYFIPEVVRMGVVGDSECNSIHAVIAHCAYLETFNLSIVLSKHAFSYCYHYGNNNVGNINHLYIVTVATSPTIDMAQTWDILNDI